MTSNRCLLALLFPLVPCLFLFLPDKKLTDTWALSLSSSMGGCSWNIKEEKRTDIGLISHRAKDHRLKVNASKSYPVHSLVLLLFSLTPPAREENWGQGKPGRQKEWTRALGLSCLSLTQFCGSGTNWDRLSWLKWHLAEISATMYIKLYCRLGAQSCPSVPRWFSHANGAQAAPYCGRWRGVESSSCREGNLWQHQ